MAAPRIGLPNSEERDGFLSAWSRRTPSYFGGMNGPVPERAPSAQRYSAARTRTARWRSARRKPLHRARRLRRCERPPDDDLDDRLLPTRGSATSSTTAVWSVTGYGTGALSLTPDDAAALETGVSMATSVVGDAGRVVGSRAAGGLVLAFKADALGSAQPASRRWAGGPAERRRGRAGPRGCPPPSRTRGASPEAFKVSLTSSVEVGLCQDGGDIETGAGMDIGGGLVTNAATGLSLDVRTRSLVVHPANSFTDRGRSNVVGVGPDTVEPTAAGCASRLHGAGQVLDDAETQCHSRIAYGMGPPAVYIAADQSTPRRAMGCRSAPASSGHRVELGSSAYQRNGARTRCTAMPRTARSAKPASAGRAAQRRRNEVVPTGHGGPRPAVPWNAFTKLVGRTGQDRWRRSCGSPRAPREPAGTRGSSHASTRRRIARPKHARHAAWCG